MEPLTFSLNAHSGGSRPPEPDGEALELAATSWLERIETGVSNDDLSRALSEALERHEITARGARAARSINTRLHQRRQREDLLRVLHETATDLTGIRDVEAILLAIVKRTRTLTGSDMAYISLNDYARNETYIRKSDGVVTEQYRTIRMPIGTGVLGNAASGAASFQTSGYVADSGIVHLPRIDEIVAAEGVLSVLGVPMHLYGKVVGALLVADREPRTYSADVVDLVDTIGKHAAVAIDNAQRFTETVEALHRLGAENIIQVGELADMQAVIALDERFIEVIVRGSGLEGFVDLAQQVLTVQACVLDPGGGALAAGSPTSTPQGDLTLRLGELEDDALRTTVKQAVASGKPLELATRDGTLTVVAARAGTTHLATLVLEGTLNTQQRLVTERLAIFLTVIRLFDQAAVDSTQRRQFEVLDDLFSDRNVPQETSRRRAATFGLLPTSTLTVLGIDPTGADYSRVERAIRAALGSTKALVAQHETHTCVVAATASDIATTVMESLRIAGIAATMGYAGPVSGFAELRSAHRRAQLALSTLTALGRRGELLDGDRLGYVGLLLDAARTGDSPDITRGSIQALIDHDDLRGTHLTQTAWVFLEMNMNLARTSEQLYVHRNTVRQRLERIAAVIGDDWLDTTRRLDLHLGLRIWRLQST
ncbi:MAG: helix-turn-helix domain-containing protein [Rhodoglobus sp.]